MNNEIQYVYLLLTLLAGLRRGKCCGQGREPQQLSEAKEQLKELFAAVSSITAAINIPSEYLLRSQAKPQQIIFFPLVLIPKTVPKNSFERSLNLLS